MDKKSLLNHDLSFGKNICSQYGVYLQQKEINILLFFLSRVHPKMLIKKILCLALVAPFTGFEWAFQRWSHCSFKGGCLGQDFSTSASLAFWARLINICFGWLARIVECWAMSLFSIHQLLIVPLQLWLPKRAVDIAKCFLRGKINPWLRLEKGYKLSVIYMKIKTRLYL